MILQYNKNNENEIVYYILGYLIFISTFFITIKITTISLMFSQVLFCVLTIISSIYIFNIQKYSIFKFDLVIFMLIFYFFSAILLTNILNKIWSGNEPHQNDLILLIVVFLNIINYTVIILKVSQMVSLGNIRIFFIILSFIYIITFLIIAFAFIFVSYTNWSIAKFINNKFDYDQKAQRYVRIDKDIDMENYLSYAVHNDSLINEVLADDSFNLTELETYVKTVYQPINKIEDYILFSAENCLNGAHNDIFAEGTKIKYIIIAQKLLFIILLLISLVSLIDLYKLNK